MEGILATLVVGGLAGWLAGQIMKGRGMGVLMNIVVGVIGGVIGGRLFGLLGITAVSGFVGSIITATIGAVLLLYIVSKLKN